jgi:hypothetical protein
MQLDVYKPKGSYYTRTFDARTQSGASLTVSFSCFVHKLSSYDIVSEFDALTQEIVNVWAREHYSVVSAMQGNTSEYLERWLCKINNPRFEVKSATVHTLAPYKHELPAPQPEKTPLDEKLAFLLKLRELSERVHAAHPELWTDGTNDGQRIDTAIEQLKGQLVGRIDPVRKALWQK